MVPNKTTLSHSRKCLLVYTSCKVIAVSGCSCPKLAHEATSADMLILEIQSKWLSVWLKTAADKAMGARPWTCCIYTELLSHSSCARCLGDRSNALYSKPAFLTHATSADTTA